jgi:hypothetical protein
MGMTTFPIAMWYEDIFMSSPSLTNGSTYYATIWVDNATSLYYDTGISTTIISKTVTYGWAWPTTTNTAASTYKFSIYVTYGSSQSARAPMIGISGGGMLAF